MKILVVGSGGREHALVWKLSQNPKVKKIYVAPGNAGMENLATCVAISPENIPELVNFAQRIPVDLTVVGPELPLSKGIVDEFDIAGLRVFGPKKNAAIIEASKCFTKEFCARHHIPTAPFEICSDAETARAYVMQRKEFPLVIKADGLASGKGVIIAKDQNEALKAIEDMMVYERFGNAGRRLLFEDFMPGEEATFMVATDGKDYVCLESAQDHKRIFDNDEGPNTGGMGAYSPAPIVTKKLADKVKEQIIEPLLSGMSEEGRSYKGILYAGLMISDGEPRLVEFNCRFGDPECQAIMYRMESDLVELIDACLDEKLAQYKIKFSSDPSVCIVLASGGYPGTLMSNQPIKGLEEAAKIENAFVFHAGTKKDEAGFLTSGGRVLGVTARGRDLRAAIDLAYKTTELITWNGIQYRRDIGKRGLAKEK